LKLIIYLASHDPNAQLNFNRLTIERRDEAEPNPLNVRTQLVEKKENNLPLDLCEDEVNKFDRITTPTSVKVKVEFIAHGVGSPVEIKTMPQGKWKHNNPEGNIYRDIKPIDLKNYFDRYASFSDGSYKFDELTLFVCNGHPFAKTLNELMPQIKINCFKEYIKIQLKDGKAYPYNIAGNPGSRIVKPANKEGDPLDDSFEFKHSIDPLNSHFPSPIHTFFSGAEEAFYPSVDMMSSKLKTSLNVPVEYSGAIYISENSFSNTSILDRLNQQSIERLIPNHNHDIPEVDLLNESHENDQKTRFKF
jgi:hypothetical protein